jgi:hypothetical protein
MVNPGEVLLKAVMFNKPKLLINRERHFHHRFPALEKTRPERSTAARPGPRSLKAELPGPGNHRPR